MKRRIISILLLLCTVFALLPAQVFTVAAGDNTQSPFTDVKSGDWFFDDVIYAVNNGIFEGIGGGRFNPSGTMTRAMFVTVMGRIAEINPAKYDGNGGFSDVADNAWYRPYVAWAEENDIIDGVGGGRFDPDGILTREQMAVITARFFDAYGVTLPKTVTSSLPTDYDSVAEWAKEAVAKLWSCGLFQGDGGRFNPRGNAIRAEAAAFCGRTNERVLEWREEVKEEEKKTDTRTTVKKKQPEVNEYSVRFYDGSRLIDTFYVEEDETLSAVPTNARTSKADGVFEGWYADKALSKPFYTDTVITRNTNVYAKYTALPGDRLTVTSFAQLDLEPNAVFTVVGDGELTTAALTLTAKDGSAVIPLIIGGSDGVYTVKADGGFIPGASYELTLASGFNFKNSSGDTMPDTIRTASFTIAKPIADSLEMNDAIKYIQDTAEITYDVDGKTLEVLTPALVDKDGGTFDYDAGGLIAGDIVCFYIGTSPEDRDYTADGYVDDPEVYVKVVSVAGDTVTFTALDENDSAALYNVPDNFPILGALPAANGGSLTLDDDADGYTIDIDAYAQIVGTADATVDKAKERVSVGDFISIYVSQDSVDGESAVYFGKITAYDGGVITYVISSADEITAAMNLYIKPAVEGDDLVTPEEKAKIEGTILSQVEKSGFAEDAAFILADLATKTDGFRNMDGVQCLLSDENGEPLSDEEIALLNLGASFELKDGVTLTVELITSGDKLHFKNGGVQIAVGVDAEFEVETKDEGKVVIDLSASFVQELAIGITADGSLVWKKILGFIPIPIGVKVSSSIDLRSFTGIRVDVRAYTVAKKDMSILDQLKAIVKNPKSVADLLPDSMGGLKEGLETAGDLMDKIDEIQGKLDQVKKGTEQALGYADDLAVLWDAAENIDGMPSKSEWAEIGKTLGKTNVSADLMNMLGLSTEKGIESGKYAESLEDLLNKYSEMLERETDWVQLVNLNIMQKDISLKAIVIRLEANFIVRTDMNIAMGASINYEVGKRFTFWFKVGLFKPTAGSSTMDLIDEQFAFQFYVMGKLGIKMGIEAGISIGIGSIDAASVGITVEFGPYVKLYGFFIYEYERTRAANTDEWVSSKNMAGALYVDFGLYLIVGFNAQVGKGLIEYSCDFVDKEYPLLEAGVQYYPYAFEYEPRDDEQVRVVDEDADSANGIEMTIPDSFLALSCMNLTNGRFGSRTYDYDNYNYSFSNPAFSIDENGVITVDVPTGMRYIECDLTVTYKYGKLAFGNYDMQVVIPLVWTNLSNKEFSEFFTASVRVGNDTDGYETVWSKRVRKSQAFTLPTEDELKALVAYDDAKFDSFVYTDGGETKTIIDNTSYDCVAEYREYSITVDGVQLADGSTESREFTTHYGDTFDFESLSETGTDKPAANPADAVFTKITGISTTAEIKIGTDKNGDDVFKAVDLMQPITGRTAALIAAGGVTATAEYADDSALVTYRFTGIDAPEYSERIRKGTASDFDFISLVASYGKAVVDITPALGKVSAATDYYVECGKLTGPEYKITFHENGGSDVGDLTLVGGSFLPNLPEPSRKGYRFDGWRTSPDLSGEFTEKLMPKTATELYAKWTAKEYTVTFNVNGGNALTGGEGTKSVTYNESYGALPTPEKSGSGFVGWFTAAGDDGVQITADSKAEITDGQTLFAHWKLLVVIPQAFVYTPVSATYAKNTQVTATPVAAPTEESGAPAFEGFVFRFMRQGDGDYITTDYPINAGVYDAVITRAADNYYAAFEQVCTAVVSIAKATRALQQPDITVTERHFSYLKMKTTDGIIDDLYPGAKITYSAFVRTGTTVLSELNGMASSDSAIEAACVSGLTPNTEYAVLVSVTGDPNYEDVTATGFGVAGKTNGAPDGVWSYNFDYWPIDNAGNYKISTAKELSSLMMAVNNGNSFDGKTFVLQNDVDMSEHQWKPIGTESAPFKGVFNGNGNAVTGLYTTGCEYAGFFGVIADNAVVCDLTVDYSYISGTRSSGGIAGKTVSDSKINLKTFETSNAIPAVTDCVNLATVEGAGSDHAYGTGGIVGEAMVSRIYGCINRGRVIGKYQTGGILGKLRSFTNYYSDSVYYANIGILSNPGIANCINYGFVKGSNNHTGGIIGLNEFGIVLNSANLGNVAGISCVGGIAGQNDDTGNCKLINCYTAGAVRGTGDYVGAVIGRNSKDKGYVGGCYYLYQSATRNGSYRNAAGTESGSLGDGTKGTDTAYFTTLTGALSREVINGSTNLITALNNWVADWNDGQCSAEWVAGADGYPLPAGDINTQKGAKQQ